MTRNTLTYLDLQEKSRANRSNEQLKAQELAIKRDELSETMSNNLRNYKINVSKNQIQKLANDQLNEREVSKIAEQLRHNLEQEGIDKNANDIKKLDVILSAAKPSGRSVFGLLTSYALNNHMLSSLGLESPVGNNINKILRWFQTSNPDEIDFTITSGDSASQTRFRPSNQTTGGGVKNSYANPRFRESINNRTFSSGRDAMHNRAWRYDEEEEESAQEIHRGGRVYTPREYKMKFGNSKGGNVYEGVATKNETFPSSGNGTTNIGQGSGFSNNTGSNRTESGKSGIIYSPSTQNKEKGGPGESIGIAFS